VESFSELYKNDRVQILNSLKGMPDSSTAERFVFLIVEVREINKSLYMIEAESMTALALSPDQTEPQADGRRSLKTWVYLGLLATPFRQALRGNVRAV